MSVIDFISVRRQSGTGLSESTTSPVVDKTRPSPTTLSASQFARHMSQVAEDELRRAIKRQVDTIDPREMIDLAKMSGEMKAKYIATTLTMASNRTPITDAEMDHLKGMRMRLQELEAAYNEVNEAIGAQLVDVRGVTKE